MSKPGSTTVVRLDKLLANLGYGSRKEIQSRAKAGAIELDGTPIAKADVKVALTDALCTRLRIDNETLDPLPGLTLVLNKPVGATCSHKEQGPLVYNALPARWRQRDPALSTIGRLDKDTSGLLLITDDGAFLHRVISPKNRIAKRYHVTLDRPLIGAEQELFLSGTLILESETKPLAPAHLEVISDKQAYLTITEGRYHQVRRMFAAAGNHVTALHRDRVGGMALPDDLPAGEWRILSGEEREQVFGSSAD